MIDVRWHPWRAASGALAAVLLLAAGAAWADPPDRAIRLSYTSGEVSFLPAGDNDWVQARRNRPLWIGDRLWVAGGARAELQMGNAALRAAPETSLSVVNFDDRTEQFEVTQGAVDLFVRDLGGESAIEIDTPNLAFTIRRPGEYRIDVSADATTVGVLRGEGEAFGAQNAYMIGQGTRYRFHGTDLTDYEPVALERDAFDTWVAQRVTLEQRSASLRYVSPDVIGYEDLDANGTWRDVPQYGEVWFPTHVAADWAPYRDGHWAWVDPWGWTWIDDAPWGFAPFHYGRWAFVDSRWCWVPGSRREQPVYAPALVAFVGGASFGAAVSVGGGNAVGWFPLGPGDVYRPAYHVSREYFTRVNVTNTTVNVTNITNVYNNPTTNIRYTNVAVSNAVTAVPAQAFVQAQPVQRVAVRVDTRAVEQAVQRQPQVVAAAPPVTPTRTSFIGSAQAAQAKPAQQVTQRTVVARQAPPPAPSSIQQREQLVQQQKKPIEASELQKLAPAQGGATRPNVKVAQPTAAPKPIPPTSARAPEKGAPTAAAPTRRGQPPVAEAPNAGEKAGAQPPTQARPGAPGAPPQATARPGTQPQPPQAAANRSEERAKEAERGAPPTARAPAPQPSSPQRPETATAQRPTPPQAARGPAERPEAPTTVQRPTPPQAARGPAEPPKAATAQQPTPPRAARGPAERPEATTAQRPTPPQVARGPAERPEAATAQRPPPQAQAARPPQQAQAPRPAPQEAPRSQPSRPPEAAMQHPPVAQAPPQPRVPEGRPQGGGPPQGAALQAQARPSEKGPPAKSPAEREKEKQKEEGK